MNEDKKKTESEYYSDGCRIEKFINNKGDVIEEHFFNSRGNLETTYQYKYSDQGICIEESEYNAKGVLISKTNYN